MVHQAFLFAPPALKSTIINAQHQRQPSLSSINNSSFIAPKSRCAYFKLNNVRVANAYPAQKPTFIKMALADVALNSLTVLVVGSGGREHALVNSLLKSPYLAKLMAAPGNIGMSGECECIPSVQADNVDAIVDLAVSRKVSLVIVGPEAPLVLGLVDRLLEKNILAFGPTAEAAELEGSKIFSKCFLERHNIPSAAFAAFCDVEPAKLYVQEMGAPIVVKASGLAAGKGVILAKTVDEAYEAIDNILTKEQFGEAGSEVVIEQLLTGEEVSFFAIVDGDTALPLASAQDHKPAYDGDEGPNTGGMGAYSPAPICTKEMEEDIMNFVVTPTIAGMKKEGYPFRGILYCGMMVDKEKGDLNVLEFNVRFGDPECQVLCDRLRTDMLELLYRAANGTLGKDNFSLEWSSDSALLVVMATNGYPGKYEKGSVIRDIEAANKLDGVTVYHAGTELSESGEVVANGGRVLGVTAMGSSIRDAQKNAYEAVDTIDWPEGFCRRDIGWRAIAHEDS